MAQYAIAFDLDTKAMRADHMSESNIVRVYQTEIPVALAACGFDQHPQGSLYHTSDGVDPITAIMKLQSTVKAKAQTFCQYVRKVHVFRMEEWSDVTSLIRTHPVTNAQTTAEDEVEQNEFAAPESARILAKA